MAGRQDAVDEHHLISAHTRDSAMDIVSAQLWLCQQHGFKQTLEGSACLQLDLGKQIRRVRMVVHCTQLLDVIFVLSAQDPNKLIILRADSLERLSQA